MPQDLIAALRDLALRHPDVTEGIACENTAMERRTMKVGDTAFLFLGASDALVKLDSSLSDAKHRAKSEPERYRVGANGWVKLMFSTAEPPALDLAALWIAESYLLFAPKPAAKAPRPKSKRPA